MSKMTATYNGEDERWVLTGEALEQPVFGVRRLEAPGFFYPDKWRATFR